MKYKRAIVLLVSLTGLSVACGIGSGNEKCSSFLAQESAPCAYAKESESDRIAVVNLDEGITRQGKRVNYAEKISRFPGINFEYASLEAARSGFKSGKYGAYIVIPAVFSQNVESINDAPQVSQLEYVINKSYSGEKQYELLYNVLSYMDTLGSKLSYMYVNNVLKEFHEAQDSAESIMENDLRDKAAIDSIKAQDLIALTEIPEVKPEENTTEVLDISGYTEKDVYLTEAIDEEYMRCVHDVQSQLDALGAGGTALSQILENLSEQVSEIDIMSDEKGESITEKADEMLEKELEEQSGAAPDRKSLNRQLMELKEKNEELEQRWEQSNRIYHANLDTELENIRQQYLSDIQENLPALRLEYDTQGNLVLTFEESGQEEELPEIIFYRQENSGQAPGENPADSPGTVGAGSTETAEEDADNGVYGLAYSGDIEGFTDYIRERCEIPDAEFWRVPEAKGLLYDDEDYPVTDDEGQQRLCSSLADDNGRRIDNLLEEVSEAKDLDAGRIRELVKEEFTDPVEKNAEDIKADFTQRYKQEADSVAVYRQQIAAFHPQTDDSFLTGTMEELVKNHTSMQEELAKNNTAYKEYAEKAAETAEENVERLKKHIEEAKEESDEAIEGGLDEAKRIKEESSRVNQTVLKDFSRRLLYTRLGSAENTQVYQFMANPLITSDQSETPGAESKSEIFHTEKRTEQAENEFPWITVCVSMGILLVILSVRMLCDLRKRRSAYNRRADSNVRRKKI